MNEIVCHHFLYLDNEAKCRGEEEREKKSEIVVDLFFFFLSTIATAQLFSELNFGTGVSLVEFFCPIYLSSFLHFFFFFFFSQSY